MIEDYAEWLTACRARGLTNGPHKLVGATKGEQFIDDNGTAAIWNATSGKGSVCDPPPPPRSPIQTLVEAAQTTLTQQRREFARGDIEDLDALEDAIDAFQRGAGEPETAEHRGQSKNPDRRDAAALLVHRQIDGAALSSNQRVAKHLWHLAACLRGSLAGRDRADVMMTMLDERAIQEAGDLLGNAHETSGEYHGLDNARQVFFYEQDFYILSNFSAFALFWSGRRFHTSEHLYHWLKFPDFPGLQAAILSATSAHEAFKIAERERSSRREDWDRKKVGIMRDILRAKAEQHEYVRRKLEATGDRELIENSWRDDFWGWGPNRDGQNMLGKLWMEIRAERRAVKTSAPPVCCPEFQRAQCVGECVSAPGQKTNQERYKAIAEGGTLCAACGAAGVVLHKAMQVMVVCERCNGSGVAPSASKPHEFVAMAFIPMRCSECGERKHHAVHSAVKAGVKP